MTKKVKAVFKGQDGSCGYTTGMEYTLIVHHQKNSLIKIEKLEFGGDCEYESLLSFLENWDNIRNL